MKKLLVFAFVFCLISLSSPTLFSQSESQNGFLLPDGTPIKLRLGRTMSSADAKTGETVDFEVLEDVKINEVVLITRGTIALGSVVEAQAKRRMGRGGKLDMIIESVRLVNGEKIPLRASKESKGGGKTGIMAGAMVATGILFFPAAPVFLLIKGKDITVPKGTEITAYTHGDIILDPKSFATPSPTSVGESTPPASELVPVSITSIPEGADIEIAGKFVGNTPSTIRLKPGDHRITVRKSGYTVWERDISIQLGDSITLSPTLDRENR